MNEVQKSALAMLHAALISCRDAQIEIVPGSPGIYVRDHRQTWHIVSKGDSLESYDLAEYQKPLRGTLSSLQRYGATTQEAEAMFEDEQGAWVKLVDVQSIEIELPLVCQSDDPFDLKRDIICEIEAAGLKVSA